MNTSNMSSLPISTSNWLCTIKTSKTILKKKVIFKTNWTKKEVFSNPFYKLVSFRILHFLIHDGFSA